MEHLHQVLAVRVAEWRDRGYPCDEFPAIIEVLEYQVQSEEVSDGSPVDTLRSLREPQRRALETYWYLRLIETTPHIPDLYAEMFLSVSSRRNALGLTNPTLQDIILDEGLDKLLERLRTDDALVREHGLFAEAKDWHGMRRFRLRRLEKVNIEALLIAAGQNLKRLLTAWDRGPRKVAQVAALRPPNPVGRCRPNLAAKRSPRLLNEVVFQQAVAL